LSPTASPASINKNDTDKSLATGITAGVADTTRASVGVNAGNLDESSSDEESGSESSSSSPSGESGSDSDSDSGSDEESEIATQNEEAFIADIETASSGVEHDDADDEESEVTPISFARREIPVSTTQIDDDESIQQSIIAAMMASSTSVHDDAVAIGIGAGIAAAMGIATSRIGEESGMSTDNFDDSEANSFDTPDFTSTDGLSLSSASKSDSSHSTELASSPTEMSASYWPSRIGATNDRDTSPFAKAFQDNKQRMSSKEGKLSQEMINAQKVTQLEKAESTVEKVEAREVPLTLGLLMRGDSAKKLRGSGGTIVSITESISSASLNAQWAAIAENNYRAPTRPSSFRHRPEFGQTLSGISSVGDWPISSVDSDSYLGSLKSGLDTPDDSQSSFVSALPGQAAPTSTNVTSVGALDAAIARSTAEARAKLTLRKANSQLSLLKRQPSMMSINEAPAHDESSASESDSDSSGSYETESDDESQ
jgi:hypothetical protein